MKKVGNIMEVYFESGNSRPIVVVGTVRFLAKKYINYGKPKVLKVANIPTKSFEKLLQKIVKQL